METINENIRQLLEMLDNPDAYTDQEIQDIVNRDDDTRERGKEHKRDAPVDAD